MLQIIFHFKIIDLFQNKNEEINLCKNNKKGVKIHTIASKLKIVKYAEEFGRVKAQLEYNVPESTLRDWIKNRDNFENVESDKLNKRTLHKGANVSFQDAYNKLIDFVECNRKLGIPITTWSLLLELFKINPERKNNKIKTNLQLIYRFMDKYGYSFRCGTHIGQSLKKDSLFNASLFWNEVHSTIKNNGLGRCNIFNMDESPIFFNMVPKKTIAKRGKKTILIKTQSQEKVRISIILTISADGDKLKPLIIFKGKTGGLIEKNLSKNSYVISNKCVICVNQNAWATDSIIKVWFNNIWLEYLRKAENLCENVGYIILDRATSHQTPEILDTFKTQDKFVTFIPPGLTRFIQPLDVVVNKPFKDHLRKKYIEYCTNINDLSAKITRETMIQFICDSWYDPKIITSDMIKRSFECTGIVYSPNQDKDVFTAWKKMNEENDLIADDLGDDFGDDEKKGMIEEMDLDIED